MKRHTGYGWLELIEGILLIILGALAIASPGGILRWITIFYGVMAIVTGITDIIFYAKSERYFLLSSLRYDILKLCSCLLKFSKLCIDCRKNLHLCICADTKLLQILHRSSQILLLLLIYILYL